nr:winged helix-turn-helix domain-containing protein [Granulicella aggregans]
MQAGKPLAIEPKALNVLIFLAQNQGRLIERRELLSAVWGDAFVTDHVLNRSIGQLRKVLGDDAKEPRYIETVPTLGYRFIAAVETEPWQALAVLDEPAIITAEIQASERPAATVASQSDAIELEPVEAAPANLIMHPAVRQPEPVLARRIWLKPKLWLYGVGLAAAMVMATLLHTPEVAGPLESTQITFSTEFKERPIFTDGSRLYFEHHSEASEMAVSGGKVVPMRSLEPGMHLRDLSSDGSKLLAWKADLNDLTGVGSLWVSSTIGGTPRKLGDHLGDRAIWSPDGHSIVSSVGTALYGMDENGGNLRKLWEAPRQITDLYYSADAKQLCVTSELDYASRIWIMRPDGTQAHLLSVEWPDNWDIRNGRWTRDGRHFVFRSDGEGRQNMYEVVKPDWLHFWRKPKAVRITGNQIEILASVPSRTTKGLLVLGRLDQGAMQVFDPKSRNLVPFLSGFSASSFVISPDGQWMAYTEFPSDHLWKSRLDGSEATQLTESGASFQQWSPDGKWLVYTDDYKLYRVSADGGPPEILIATGNYELVPTWSPDGKSIVFNYWDGVHEPATLEILDLATRKVSPMAGAEKCYLASWSPDGKYLVAITKNPARMMMFSAKTKTWSVLKVFEFPDGFYAWSRDSKSIYMATLNERKGIYRLSVPEGTWEKVVGVENINAKNDEALLSITADNQPAIMSHTGVAQFYLLRWPN